MPGETNNQSDLDSRLRQLCSFDHFNYAHLGGRIAIAQSLLVQGANINSADSAGNTLLHTLARTINRWNEYSKCSAIQGYAEFFLSSGADPRIKNNQGKTAADLLWRGNSLSEKGRLLKSIRKSLDSYSMLNAKKDAEPKSDATGKMEKSPFSHEKFSKQLVRHEKIGNAKYKAAEASKKTALVAPFIAIIAAIIFAAGYLAYLAIDHSKEVEKNRPKYEKMRKEDEKRKEEEKKKQDSLENMEKKLKIKKIAQHSSNFEAKEQLCKTELTFNRNARRLPVKINSGKEFAANNYARQKIC